MSNLVMNESTTAAAVRRRSNSRLLVSFCASLVALTIGGIAALTVDGASYSVSVSGTTPVNWTSVTWGCGTSGPGDVCGSYPGQISSPFGTTANMFGTGTAVLNSALPQPFTLNLNGSGLKVDIQSGGVMPLVGPSQVTNTGVLNTLAISGGQLNNNGTLTLAGSGPNTHLDFHGGLFDGAGNTQINVGVFNLTGSQSPMTLNQVVTNNAQTVYSSSSNSLILQSTFQNNGTFFVNGSATMTGSGAFINTGTVSVNTTPSEIAVPFTNNGGTVAVTSSNGLPFTLSAGSGTGHVNGTWNLGTNGRIDFGGTHVFGGAAGPFFSSTTGSVHILPGAIFNLNTTNSSMTMPAIVNDGNLSFGTTNKNVQVSGPYTQTGALSLKVGFDPNGSSDVLVVNGLSTLSGTLNMPLNAAYTPSTGDSFFIFSTTTRSGDWTTKNLPPPYPGGVFTGNFTGGTPDKFQVVAAPATDIGVVKSGPPSATHNSTVPYSVKVGNVSTAPATNVVITDTFSSGTFNPTGSDPCWSPSGPTTVTCTFASMPAGSTSILALNINATTVGTITNTASLSSVSEIDTNSSNDSSTVNTTITPVSDLTIAKSGPGTVNAGAPLTYTVTVTNNGPDPIGSFSITDQLPAGVGAGTASGTGWTCPPATGTFTCTWAFSPVPASGTAPPLTISVTAPTTGGPITNNVSVSSTADTTPGNNNAPPVTTNVIATSDLGITKTGPATAVAGSNISFTITVNNAGPSNEPNVTVNDPLPPGLTFVSNTGACTTNFPCSFPLASAGTAVITSTYAVAGNATSVSNTATVSGSNSDPAPSNNTSPTVTVSITPSADVMISKALVSPIVAGSNATFTVTVTNNGPSTATNVVVSDTAPAGTTFVSNAGACTTPYPCSLGSMTPGQTLTISSTYLVAPTATGTITNTASVSTTTPDPNGANNSASAAGTIGGTSDMAIVKTGPGTANAGGSVTFNTMVTNNGPSADPVVTVNDATPPGLTFVSNTGVCTTPFPCSFSLGAGGSGAISSTYTVASNASGPITNTATVTGSQADPNASNNSSSATVTISTSADVAITKVLSGGTVAGTNTTYTITVTNNGPSDATNVVVNDATPAQTTFAGNSGACTTAFPCNLGTMTPGQTKTITSTYAIAPTATGSIANTASVTSSTPDPNSTNNSATSSAAVGSSSDLAITKTGPATATPGSTVTYTVTVTNSGPSPASAFTVNDTPSAGLTFVSNSGACTTPYPCNFASLAVGSSVVISSTFTVSPGASGSVTNTASLSGGSDPNAANNSSAATTSLSALADLAITKTGPSALPSGGAITFRITVKNNGPSSATGVVVNDTPSAGLSFVSITPVSGSVPCTAFPCNLGTMSSGQIAAFDAKFNVFSGVNQVTNTATVTSSSTDPATANNSSSVTVGSSCPSGTPTQFTPFNGQTDVPVSGTMQWTNTGGTSYQVYYGPVGTGCNTLVATVTGPSYAYTGLTPNTEYESRIVSLRGTSCPALSSTCIRWKTGNGPNTCNISAPQIISPQNGATIGSPATLRWSAVAGATGYHVVVVVNGNNVADVTTTDTQTEVVIPNGAGSWTVTAINGTCISSAASATFNVCVPPSAPLAGVVGAPSTGRTYSVLVTNPSPNDVRYEFQEADNDAFTNAQTLTSTSPSVSYTHVAPTSAVVFFYRVRAFSTCTDTPGAYSKTIRVVIVPAATNRRNPQVNVPAGSTAPATVQVFVPGEGAPVNFVARSDRPWIVSIQPSSGVLPPGGITLTVTLNPALLPNGTFTATVIISTSPIASNNSRLVGHATTKSVPVSINLVTPVVPVDPTGPTTESLIIPAVGHAAGLNSQWRSDIRIYNASPQSLKYVLNFKPLGSTEVKSTTIETPSGETTALDDIIHNWYGVGEVNDSSTGVLEIRPMLPNGTTTPPPGGSFETVVSSRTFSANADGTVGQFIPPVKFSNFIGTGSRLSMQQIAQSAAYRTNFGIVEASGSPVNLILSMFNSNGSKLFDLPVTLAGGEQKLLNGLLATQGVSVDDGRMEVRVAGGSGKVTAYASVVDNASLDPQLVPGATLSDIPNRDYIVAGVADLNNGVAAWRTDMRIYNSGSTPQSADLIFYPENGQPFFSTQVINPGEVKVLNNVVQSTFGTANLGGMVKVSTVTDSQLIVTGRTYNQTGNGTLGQFIRAATAADAVRASSRSLNILQVEDSPRFRTNVGVAEMTGRPATVEISLVLPDSKATPTITVPLNSNEFRQFSVAQFGVENVYNARLNVKVVSGSGAVTAYGSVIDQVTTDPTYVAAQ